MNYKEKLQEIMKIGKLSKQSLANNIGVSPATLDNWLSNKPTPAKNFIEKINTLHSRYSQIEDEESISDIIKYYDPYDLAAPYYANLATESLEKFDINKTNYTINDVLKLYNIHLYINSIFPKDTGENKINKYKSLEPKLLHIIDSFFNKIDENNVLNIIKNVKFEYHEDLLSMLAHYKRYDKITSNTMLQALNSSKVATWSILANKQIVKQYDQDIRTLILSNIGNAEYIIQKHFEKNKRQDIHLPKSLTKEDIRNLLDRYINSAAANPNYLQLIAQSKPIPSIGVDDKIKLLAKQKYTEWIDNHFKGNEGSLMFKIKVAISDSQKEVVDISQDGQTTTFTYSEKWLKEHSDNLSVLRNFIYIFPIVNKHILLTLPSYSSQLGVFERFMKVTGREEYPEGAHFRFIDQITLIQTATYEKFLRSEGKELESTIAWYFNKHLKDTFGIEGFSYAASSINATYLERCKHIFSEMDSVIKQFKLYTENNIIDQELLAITSKTPNYNELPSQLPDKYVYITDNTEIFEIMRYLFSDQSGLTYINDTLKDKDFASLLTNHEVKYSEFHDYQKQSLDKLIAWGIIKKTSKRLMFQSRRQILILKNLFQMEALNYHHYSTDGKAEINTMVSKGWLIKEGSLLTRSEAKYFNYCLNQKEFSNGHDLRNIYMHGAMTKNNKLNEDRHYKTYIIVIRLLIALILKIDDDLSIKHPQSKSIITYSMKDKDGQA